MKKNYKKLFHLHARAGFGINKTDADRIINTDNWISPLTDIEDVELLKFDLPEIPEGNMGMMEENKKMEMRKQMRVLSKDINIEWINQMSKGKDPLVEKMTLFWHGHFACRIVNPYDAIQYTNTLRENALGNFKDLVMGVSKSSAMIKYLHLKQNNKRKPNEDFARELCELFTLGRDQEYTEQDVKEIARSFTGWSTKRKSTTFYFNERKHDNGEKEIFGKTGNFGGEDVINMILEKKQCARFISTKIYKEFVNPTINEKNLEEITEVMYANNYDIGKTMHHIFSAKWFYSDENIGCKIKSPIELLVGLKKSFQLDPLYKKSWIVLQRNLDQELYIPPNVAGWPGDKSWIDSSRLAFRLRLPSLLLNNGEIPLAFKEDYDVDPNEDRTKMRKIAKFKCNISWSEIEDNFKEDPKKCTLEEMMVRGELSKQASQYLKDNQYDSFKERIIQIISLPEYQLC
ncbi:DUF1800 domain-containing protein [Flammeovirga agarivorans]|uniref:DUF1800 domain-containing protein n=1 Tax=Flammeovirga agarivorans TaxID=2726742 RepID=A0A7X8SIB1_9BACT|nr:DUF1800 domain-containing protein [Flammeovirga agarivorans]NLR90730.1 DUF1800 domain-containing protein [Flammeovirga agarivorans]